MAFVTSPMLFPAVLLLSCRLPRQKNFHKRGLCACVHGFAYFCGHGYLSRSLVPSFVPPRPTSIPSSAHHKHQPAHISKIVSPYS